MAHRSFGGSFASQSALYVDDGILLEWDIPGRLGAAAVTWASLARGLRSPVATKDDILDEDGGRNAGRIIPGPIVNTANLPHQTTRAKISAARAY